MRMIDWIVSMSALALFSEVLPAAAVPPSADPASRLLATLKKTYPGTQFNRVAPTPIGGLYEVWMGPNVAYVSARDVRYLVFGHLFDARTQTDLTAPKLARAQLESHPEQLAAPTISSIPSQSIDALPLADAITRVRGDGRHTLVLFSDPGCPFCRQLEPELDKLDHVAIHTFIVPFQGRLKAQAIWCAPDRVGAWHAAMAGSAATAPELAPNCAHPLERNLALARRWHVVATPTLVFGDGTRLEGFADAAELESRLAAASSHPAGPYPAHPKEIRP